MHICIITTTILTTTYTFNIYVQNTLQYFLNKKTIILEKQKEKKKKKTILKTFKIKTTN